MSNGRGSNSFSVEVGGIVGYFVGGLILIVFQGLCERQSEKILEQCKPIFNIVFMV
jgi:hypothetical protein